MTGFFSGMEKGLGAVDKARAIQELVCDVGFDWPDYSGVLRKIEEEVREIEDELKNGYDEQAKAEAGDLIFSVINLCRYLSFDPADCLERTNRKFMRRFQYVAERFEKEKLELSPEHMELMEKWWEESKTDDDEIMLEN